MKCKRIPELEWSKWNKDWLCGNFTYLHTWRESTHVDHHKVEMWRTNDNRYECYIMGGAYGETLVLRETYDNAQTARKETEKAVQYALKEGYLCI